MLLTNAIKLTKNVMFAFAVTLNNYALHTT